MKKSKFLLLGSVASLASIPFVAAKCGETKEEEKKKPEGDQKPGGDKNPGENKTPGGNTDQGKNPSENTEPGKNPGGNTEQGKNPSENTEPGKNPGGDNQTESDEEPKEEVEKAYREAAMEWVLETLEWVHRGEQGSTNFGIGWGQNHRWGMDDEKGTVGNPGAESGTKAKDSKTESSTKAKDPKVESGTKAKDQ